MRAGGVDFPCRRPRREELLLLKILNIVVSQFRQCNYNAHRGREILTQSVPIPGPRRTHTGVYLTSAIAGTERHSGLPMRAGVIDTRNLADIVNVAKIQTLSRPRFPLPE